MDSNTNYAVKTGNSQGTPNINATNNYWVTADENEIKEKIYDWFDDDILGIVEYSPFLTEPDPNCTPIP